MIKNIKPTKIDVERTFSIVIWFMNKRRKKISIEFLDSMVFLKYLNK